MIVSNKKGNEADSNNNNEVIGKWFCQSVIVSWLAGWLLGWLGGWMVTGASISHFAFHISQSKLRLNLLLWTFCY